MLQAVEFALVMVSIFILVRVVIGSGTSGSQAIKDKILNGER